MKNIDDDFVIDTYKKILLNPEKAESIIDLIKGKKQVDDKMPISIELHLTNRCNLNCEWCVDKKMRSNKDLITWEALKTLIADIAWKGIGITVEGGGEPTLYEWFDEFIMECRRNGIRLGLITNGVKELPVEILRCFDWIRVSLDATNEEEYRIEKGVNQFDQVVRNIKRIARKAPDVVLSIGYVITNRNVSQITNLFELFKDVKIQHFRIRTVEECPELMLEPKEVTKLNKRLKAEQKERKINVVLSLAEDSCEANNDLPCIAHSLRAIIHADGNVVLCEKRRHDMITLGNINQDKFSDIWRSDEHIDASQKLLDSENQRGCAVCRVTKFNEIFMELCEVETPHFI
ncbi:MAG: Radical domain protein [Herbinix sp.]|nr:Radical domain protein [Herbinix sp.]